MCILCGVMRCSSHTLSHCQGSLDQGLQYQEYHKFSNIRCTKSQTLNVSCPILQLSLLNHWSQVLSWEWRCSWSSANRRCSTTTSEWSTILLPTKARLISETWWYLWCGRTFGGNLIRAFYILHWNGNVVISMIFHHRLHWKSSKWNFVKTKVLLLKCTSPLSGEAYALLVRHNFQKWIETSLELNSWHVELF